MRLLKLVFKSFSIAKIKTLIIVNYLLEHATDSHKLRIVIASKRSLAIRK